MEGNARQKQQMVAVRGIFFFLMQKSEIDEIKGFNLGLKV